MHESIARALYRGSMRTIETAQSLFESRMDYIRGKRGPWLREASRRIEQMPEFVIMAKCQVSAKQRSAKHATAYFYGLMLDKVDDEHRTWLGTAVRLNAKTFSVDIHDLPILVSHHAVQRVVQRMNVPDVLTAVSWFSPTFLAALVLDRPAHPEDRILLPAFGGAALAVADKNNPECWAIATFVDQGRLRSGQRTALAVTNDTVNRKMAEAGFRVEIVAQPPKLLPKIQPRQKAA